jgi:D-alanine-D-alanine ligase
MMNKKKVLLLCGGGSTEHDVSLVSVKHIKDSLKSLPHLETTLVEIQKSGNWVTENGDSFTRDPKNFDFAIPCIHGYPGETGDIQAYFEMINLPYLGCNSETSKMCFNKITTKMWAEALGVKTTPYIFLADSSEESLQKVKAFQEAHGDLVIKASNQGSSVGCYLVEKGTDPKETLLKAFTFSPFVLVEKRMKPREIEVSVYEFDQKLQVSYPGEIICPSNFYSYEEKYSKGSQTLTETRAQNLTSAQVAKITDYSQRLYHGLKIRHLSRIDFFLDQGEIYLNEINTFPGLTPISMFPKMMEANGHSFQEFLRQHIEKS